MSLDAKGYKLGSRQGTKKQLTADEHEWTPVKYDSSFHWAGADCLIICGSALRSRKQTDTDSG